MRKLLIILSICFTNIYSQDVVGFQVFGMDDGIKSTREQDYNEALIDAKLKALAEAGIEIKTKTEVKDPKLIEEMIESKLKEVVFPGMSITEIGYNDEGFYQILIVGEIRSGADGVFHNKLRYALSLYRRLEYEKSKKELDQIIATEDEDDLVAEAYYLKIKWKFTDDYQEEFEKLKAFYPQSKFVQRAKTIVDEFQRIAEEKEKRSIVKGTTKANFIVTSDLSYGQTGYSLLKGATFTGVGNYQLKNYQDIYVRGCCVGHYNNEYMENIKDLYLDFDNEYEIQVQYYYYTDKSTAFEKNKFIKFRTPAYNKDVKSFLINVVFDSAAGVTATVEPKDK